MDRKPLSLKGELAGWTGLEPATSDVTGRRSNRLNYHPARGAPGGGAVVRPLPSALTEWAVLGSNE